MISLTKRHTKQQPQNDQATDFMLFAASSSASAPGKFNDARYDVVNFEMVFTKNNK